MYNFDSEEAIRRLGLENLSLIRKQMAKREASAKRESNVKREPKKREAKEKKSSFPMPFVATCVIENGCQGLAYNRGLFTQCQKSRMENGTFCSGCQGECDKNASGCPDCGTVEQRVATGLYEFKDSKGRSPISYLKVLAKLKLSTEQAIEEAGKMNLEIDEEHFVVAEKVKGKAGTSSRGRPKRPSAQVEANNVEDLFAGLTAESEELGEEIEEKPGKGSKKSKLTEEEKETKRLELEAERAAKKLERDAKLAQEKLEREAKRAAEAEQRKQEREAKLALEKAEREAARLKEKEERDAKKAAEKAAHKKSSKSSKSETKSENVAPTGTPVVTPVAPAAPAPAKVTVTRIQIGGKQYLKSSANILYDPDTKEELGLYDPETKTIKPLPEDDEEEEEEDYDEEEA
jgi:hypothetical protein